MVMENQGIKFPESKKPDIFIAAIGDKANSYAEKMVYELRKEGLSAEKDLMGKSLKAQMKYADKLGAKYSIALAMMRLSRARRYLRIWRRENKKK